MKERLTGTCEGTPHSFMCRGRERESERKRESEITSHYPLYTDTYSPQGAWTLESLICKLENNTAEEEDSRLSLLVTSVIHAPLLLGTSTAPTVGNTVGI